MLLTPRRKTYPMTVYVIETRQKVVNYHVSGKGFVFFQRENTLVIWGSSYFVNLCNLTFFLCLGSLLMS